MANGVKRKDPTVKQWSARLTMLLWVGGLAVLVTQLPPPGQLWAAVSGSAPVTAPAPLAAVASVLVTTAGLIAWLLVGWAAVVLAVGLIARLPGRSGRRARRLLPRIAPSAVGRLVAAAVGVSLLAGTAACAAPAGASASARPAPAVNVVNAVTAGAPVSPAVSPAVSPDVTPAPGTTTTAPTSSIAIDWPTPDPAIPGSTTPSPAAPSQTAPSQAAPSQASPSPTAPSQAVPTSTPGPVAPEPTSAAPASPSPTPPATASPSPVPFSPTSESPVPGSPTPNPTAGIPAQTPAPAAPPPASAAPPTGAPASTDTDTDTGGAVTVTVQPGDSLWRIAARTLGPGASDADIDNAWRAWYFTNQQVVGDDPDQIVPGQQLTAPTVAGQVRS